MSFLKWFGLCSLANRLLSPPRRPAVRITVDLSPLDEDDEPDEVDDWDSEEDE